MEIVVFIAFVRKQRIFHTRNHMKILIIFRFQAALSNELTEAGLVGWFWLHNKDAAQAIAPRFPLHWSHLSRQPLAAIREYFGSR